MPERLVPLSRQASRKQHGPGGGYQLHATNDGRILFGFSLAFFAGSFGLLGGFVDVSLELDNAAAAEFQGHVNEF